MGADHKRAPALNQLNRVSGKDADQIKGMFASIAHRYDVLNHFLSCRRDRYWRKVALARLSPLLSGDARILDLCTGTADLALEMASRGRVVGCDFCHPMLVLGTRKLQMEHPQPSIHLVEGDALQLPFRPGSFDAVTIAFGLRNLADYTAGLREMFEMLRPGGALAVLEFAQPRMLIFRQAYHFYFTRILPRLGRYFSGDREAYHYLPRSVREFPDPESLNRMIEGVGFQSKGCDFLTGGIVTLHLAKKPDTSLTRANDADQA